MLRFGIVTLSYAGFEAPTSEQCHDMSKALGKLYGERKQEQHPDGRHLSRSSSGCMLMLLE